MRKRLLVSTILSAVMAVGAVQAADLSAPAGVAFDWSGFYVGVHGGYAWGRTEWTKDLAGFPREDAEYDTEGAIAGGQIGYNWQFDQIVLGVEADGSWADIDGSGLDDTASCLTGADACTTKIDALGTVTGRFGVAFDRTLFFTKGGLAIAHAEYTTGYTFPIDPGFNYSGEADDVRIGWTVGAGLEHAFSSNWSAKIEYNYIKLSDDSVDFDLEPPQTFSISGEPDESFHVIKAGINYRF